MTKTDIRTITGAFAILGQTLEKSGLVGKNWGKIKLPKDASFEDREITALFDKVERTVKDIGVEVCERQSKFFEEAKDTVPEDIKNVNFVLLGLYFVREFGDSVGGAYKILLSNHANRCIDMVIDRINDVNNGRRVSINTHKVKKHILEQLKKYE